MCARSLTSGSLDHVAQTWGKRIRGATPKLHPGRLYCGRAFMEGQKAAGCLGAGLTVISAGYGLVSEQEEIAPYSLTVVPGNTDSIARKVPRSEWAPNAWWRTLGENTPAKINLRTYFEKREPDLILISLSAGYAYLLQDEFQDLTPDQKLRLRIFCAADSSVVLPTVVDNVMPYDARLDGPDSPIRGTMSDFSGRALHHYARRVRDGIIRGTDLSEDRADLMTLTKDWGYPYRPRRKRQTDGEIITFILRNWSRTGVSTSASLRLLRESGYACEQGRFRDLFNRAIVGQDAYRKDVK